MCVRAHPLRVAMTHESSNGTRAEDEPSQDPRATACNNIEFVDRSVIGDAT
jgi:hypothetical protein